MSMMRVEMGCEYVTCRDAGSEEAVLLCPKSIEAGLIDVNVTSRTYHLACGTHNMGQSLAAFQPRLPPQTGHSEKGFHPNSPPPMCQDGPCSKQAFSTCSQDNWCWQQWRHMDLDQY